MIRSLLIVLALAAAPLPVLAQSASAPNFGLSVSYDRANALYTFKWWGEAGKSYQVKYSVDLTTWISLQAIVQGQGRVESLTYPGSDSRWFLRVEKIADPLDIDGDGMADSWELAHFPSLTLAAILPGADADGDGVSNLLEYRLGRNPNNAAVNPVAVSLSVFTPLE